jgi:hypothetical protein
MRGGEPYTCESLQTVVTFKEVFEPLGGEASENC